MATNDNVKQRKKDENSKSEASTSQTNWAWAQNENGNSWNNWTNFSAAPWNSSSTVGGSPSDSRTEAESQTQPQAQPQAAQPQQPQYKTANEYAQAVQQWLWQYQCWNQMNQMYYSSFPFYAMSCWPMQQPIPGVSTGTARGAVPGVPGAGPGLGQNLFGGTPAAPQQAAGAARFSRPATEQGQRQGQEYRIPSLWKRVLAEFIDFLLLFLVKLAVTILTVEYVGIVDIQKYDLDYLLNQNLDYNAAFAMTSELVAMEVINRIFICIFETLCLRKGVAGSIGGTTPGKRMMGLRVVSCEDIVEYPGRSIRVMPAQDIGFWNALVRSVIKNFSLAFFFPVCFTVFFFQHNRAAYDIIANCIVVEPLRDDWPRQR